MRDVSWLFINVTSWSGTAGNKTRAVAAAELGHDTCCGTINWNGVDQNIVGSVGQAEPRRSLLQTDEEGKPATRLLYGKDINHVNMPSNMLKGGRFMYFCSNIVLRQGAIGCLDIRNGIKLVDLNWKACYAEYFCYFFLLKDLEYWDSTFMSFTACYGCGHNVFTLSINC